MNKKWAWLVIVLVMGCSLAGCGGSRSGSDGAVHVGSSEPPGGGGDPRK
ncbi:MAG: hypothetical protein AB7F75_04910 [Planctomycetota bacterium]